ncbi:hypothetical protein B0T17DRAFT_255060 [Bombardia bombarda]|uniref:Rhodopsin domain-containing protein n=1 Tax=Bombardia bombarda TaxID=252184 RepID=A0AA39X075_9PEZI|nr:hypothetical protein B0T17DRAFT_255060 [Bombardia bombarda]
MAAPADPTVNYTVTTNYTLPTNFTLPANTTIWGPIPDDKRRSLQPDIIACAILTWLIGLIFVVLRFYTRGRLNHVIGPSDWFIIPALLCSAGVTASSVEQAYRGAGKHSWEVDIYTLPALERAAWYGILFYSCSLTFTRISILLLYKRIFTYNWAKKAIQVALTMVVAIGIWFIASVCSACVPLEAFWNWSLFWVTPVYCQPANIWWGNAALHITSDLLIMTLPLPILSTLKLPRRQKFALVGVFALGFFVCIVSILRLVTLIDVTYSSPIDSTYKGSNLVYWTTVEVNASIVCACIMTMKPLIQKLFPRLLSQGQYVREQSLQWITPIGGGNSNRNSRQSCIHPNSTRRATASSPRSPTSECGSNFKIGSFLPRVEMREGYHHVDAVLKETDIEAQRSDSVSTMVAPEYDDEESGGPHARDDLRAPPRAHLRLSIHVTKEVNVSKYPESPMFGSSDEKIATAVETTPPANLKLGQQVEVSSEGGQGSRKVSSDEA